MKLPVHCFVLTEDEIKLVQTIKLDDTFEWKLHHWGQGQWNNATALDSAHRLFRHQPPAVWITIHPDPAEFKVLFSMPFEIRKKWLHFGHVQNINPVGLISCFLQGNVEHPGQEASPVISYFTPACRSGDRILRPYESLRAQTYTNWEWVIVCDAIGDDDPNWKRIQGLAETDCRIVAARMSCHNGYIGAMKKYACGLASGELLVELDHDDEIIPKCSEYLVQAMKQHPECGFFYSDFIEAIEDLKAQLQAGHKPKIATFEYPLGAAFGFIGYVMMLFNGEWVSRYVTQGTNPSTLHAITGFPNHLRAWRTKLYHQIGGHNKNYSVVDDWELGLRTFHATKWCHLHEMMYIQYRNEGGNNQTFIRNALIQDLVRLTRVHYESKNKIKFMESKVPWPALPYAIEYECDGFRYPCLEEIWKPRKFHTISIVIPTYNRPALLLKALESALKQTYSDIEIYIIGDNCPHLKRVMNESPVAKDPRVMWYNLPKNYGPGGATARNYFHRLCPTTFTAMLDDDNTWEPNHLQSLWDKMQSGKDLSFVWSSMRIDGKPIIFKQFVKGRIDTSCILFRSELMRKYGFWKDRIRGGYSHDFELFSRWVAGREKWAVTLLPTCNYNCDTNEQTYESILRMVDDQ